MTRCFVSPKKKHQAKRELQRRRMKGEEWTEELGQKSKKDVPAKNTFKVIALEE